MKGKTGSSWLLVLGAVLSFSGLACDDDDDDGAVLSSDADLVDLLVSAGVLTPAFDPSTTSYSVSTTSSMTSTTVTPFSSDAGATLEINGQAIVSGFDFGPAPLVEGMNSFDVVVTAEDGTTTKTYSIVVTRPPPTLPAELAAVPAAELLVSGSWLVYLASEAFNGVGAGTDFNGDADTLDGVAVALNMTTSVEETLGVATRSAAVVGDEVYLVVDEDEDGRDWNVDLDEDDNVLLHWSQSSATVVFVDELRPSTDVPDLLVVDTRLYYCTDSLLGAGDETPLRFVAQATPTIPVAVLNEAGGGAVQVSLLAEDEGLVFLTLDENDTFHDLNGDGDLVDGSVLALLDGTDPAARLKSVELALQTDVSPVDARSIGPNDWLIAFLVDETAQGRVSLNDQNDFGQPLLPPTCAGTVDVDASDEVLHFLDVSDFLAGTATPIDTGLVGHERVLAFTGFVATISDELDANCDLNVDGDVNDGVARWVATVTPVAPAREAAQMHALATSIAGGSMGLAHLDERLIAVVSEADDEQDLDVKPEDHDLVGWLDPALGTAATWNFAHQHPTISNFGTGVFDTDGDSEPFAGTDWMAAEPSGDRLGVSFLEEVPGTNPNVGSLNSNLDCTPVMKDTDKIDALPIWADFETGPTLDWDGLGYAVDRKKAGVVIASGNAFFRVSEGDDNRDYNDDGDLGDIVVFRNPLTACSPQPLATGSALLTDAIETDGILGAAFLTSESMAGIDLNSDGDTSDVVARYFLF